MAFYQLPLHMISTIFMFVIAGMGLQERLALKAALNFMVPKKEERKKKRMILKKGYLGGFRKPGLSRKFRYSKNCRHNHDEYGNANYGTIINGKLLKKCNLFLLFF